MITLILKTLSGFFSSLDKFLWFAKSRAEDEDIRKAAKAKTVVETRDAHVEAVEKASKDAKALDELRKMAAE